MLECARKGNSYVASTTFAPPASAFSASPSFRSAVPGVPSMARIFAKTSAVPSVFALEVSHSTVSALRPWFAVQNDLASTATPVGICTTSTTPSTALAFDASNDFTVAPKSGGCATTAVSIPGSFTSCVYCAVPVLLALASTRGVTFSFPM